MGLLARVKLDVGQLRSALRGAVMRGQSLERPLGKIGALMVSSVQRNFDVGGRPLWKKLEPTKLGGVGAVFGKRRRSASSKILVSSGALRKSVTYEVGPRHVDVGTNVFYARFNQPERPFLVVQPADEAEAAAVLEQWLGAPLRGRA